MILELFLSGLTTNFSVATARRPLDMKYEKEK